MHRCGVTGEGMYMCTDVASQVRAHVHRCGVTGEGMYMCTDVASQVRARICAQMWRHR